ncbi:Radical SAM domain protein [Pyrolobus fumarii 1A]|uniref:GTP 3',8-cyclase n=1 Tax=Pyrolobus fumarii (strain DSM 11204 / 1A) TaxID=694429 RepID=G0EHP3_PYRF1|nr:GTP 3',8-cyclase MoaA [Pyrolobus fumarii]AEM39396.1 Radical SAM domain protein [Pyrolobus fumarii 1A]
MPLWDRYGRPLLNVRFVVTLRCNFRCFFCHSEGMEPRDREEMKPEDYAIVSEAAKRVGVISYKITGGEPLVRHDILEVVKALHAYNPRAEISMTTNAYFLARYAQGLAEYGVRRVNVSLHSLRPERFRAITGVDGLKNVLDGLFAAHEAGLGIKINVVALRGLNTDEIEDLIDFAAKINAKLQIIELHPVNIDKNTFDKFHEPYTQIIKRLEKRTRHIKYRSDLHNRVILEMDNGVEVEVVGPVGNPVFCAGCTRVRITPYGEVTACLNRGYRRVEFLSAIRKATDFDEAVNAVIEAFRSINALREPFYIYRRETPSSPRTKKSFRIYLPKRSGTIPSSVEQLLLEEWIALREY